MAKIILVNKPYGVLCQFTGDEPNLSNLVPVKSVYPAGRLDKDSEGLVLLTDDGKLQARISHPRHKMKKTYWVQVDGEITDTAVDKLKAGVRLKDGLTKPASANRFEPIVAERDPPVRFRKHIPTSWITLTIAEGKNRQVRRMTAAVGFPTLRLLRHSIGDWDVDGIPSGEFRQLEVNL